MTTPPETPVSVAELSEVFQLGGALSEIKTTLGFVRGTVEKTDSTVNGMSARLGSVEVILGRHEERISNVEKRPVDDHSIYATKDDLQEVKDEVRSHRLSWPKVGALVAAGVGIAALATFANTIIPG